ncbi:MAG: hypothetical protein QMD17_08680 [Rhodocyclaceae bacterium]|nr:hypothetical protein [Rhodocyclaceae bacterium]
MPLKAEVGLSAGLKLEYGRVRINDRINPADTAHGRGLNGLASWSFASGQIMHFNVDREWLRVSGPNEANNSLGVGFDQPLLENLRLTLETYGAEHGRPDKQVGLRWTVAEGVKLSGAVGRGNGRGFGNAGIAREF